VRVDVQGRHRYYTLPSGEVASLLEGLIALAGGSGRGDFVSRAPSRLRSARTCYDHIAGTLGVAIHDRLVALRWLSRVVEPEKAGYAGYEVSKKGEEGFESFGIDVGSLRAQRRRFACACLDWSERRPHLGGALGAAILKVALQRKWVDRDLDSRALSLTERGKNELQRRLAVRL
jgi:hypothetical protein